MLKRFVLAGVLTAALLMAAYGAPEPAAAQPTNFKEKWAALKAAAQKEGRVVFRIGSSEARAFREHREELQKILGIKLEIITGSSRRLVPKLVAERGAGRYTADLWLSGPSSVYSLLIPAGAIKKLQPDFLFHPEVVGDAGVWFGDGFPYADPEQERQWAYGADPDPQVYYNTKRVNPDNFKSFQDLLDPKWKGKIVVRDPRGSGVTGPAGFLVEMVGKEWVRKLWSTQKIVIAPDARTGAEWLAQGRYLIGLYGFQRAVTAAKRDGLPVAALHKPFPEGIQVGMGGRGFHALTKAPHPNAAKYFGNWFLSREGQMFYQRITGDNSLRTDIPKDDVTPDDRIDPKGKNWYDWKKVIQRQKAQKFHRKLLAEIGGY